MYCNDYKFRFENSPILLTNQDIPKKIQHFQFDDIKMAFYKYSYVFLNRILWFCQGLLLIAPLH